MAPLGKPLETEGLRILDGWSKTMAVETSLLALAELLSGPRDEDEEDDEDRSSSATNLGPGNIGAPKTMEPAAASQMKSANSKEIWSAEEVLEGSEYDDSWDFREQPEYEIMFQQQVRTEDMFLGMSRKDPSTACCEDMLIKIHLPDTKASDITLDIKEKILDLRTPQKKLLLHLPHPVDPDDGKACFVPEKSSLEVTLHMKREFDFINFA
ncbi:dynein axonemal assembly factor 6 isoform X2 [Sphaerodactylus townsendi]|uniref:dynein axonemal assembly factor 6 isoform X2 n=1 Tax=Sphaerodactylus townsendi TaxID=933632 RepID=UPI0020260BEC|nr:dynein axonemal assembly factor 6 isoform X2 [Sphaerodactylus townsendi]